MDGVAAVGDRPAVLAAAAAEMFGVPFHPHAAALACHDKHLARRLYRRRPECACRRSSARFDEDPAMWQRARLIPAC